MHKRIKCRNNKGLVCFIDPLKIKTVHDITEGSKDQTILLTFRLWFLYD